MTQNDVAKSIGMLRHSYARYECGITTPENLAVARGLLLSVKTPLNVIEKHLFPDDHKPITAALEMSDREEALIQWLSNQIERCLSHHSRNKLASVAVFAFALEFDWIPWKSSTDLIEWVKETTGKSITKQAISKQIGVIRDSFASACKGVTVADREKILDDIAVHQEVLDKLRKKIA